MPHPATQNPEPQLQLDWKADHTQLLLGEHKTEKRQYTAEYAVCAFGGTQSIAKSISDPLYRKKCVQGLKALSPHGIDDMRLRLANSKGRKVVIIGGSHTAFSVAWALLNKVCGKDGKGLRQANFDIKKGDITIVHRSKIRLFYSSEVSLLASMAVKPLTLCRNITT